MPYAHDGSSGSSPPRAGGRGRPKSPPRRGRRGRPKNPSAGGETPTYNPSPPSYSGPAPSSSSSGNSAQSSAADLQQQYLAAQRAATAKAEAKAAAEKRAAEDEAAKKARAESVRQNSVTRQQAIAQFTLLDRFGRSRRVKLGNIERALATADKALMKSYKATSGQLVGARQDNEKAEGAASFANTTNRLRESGDLLGETSAMGAGESDTMRAQLQAVRNWDANQGEVGRSFFDTLRTVNSSITDLNNDTRTSRINVREQAYSDKEQVWANYYDRVADTWTQIYNIEGSNPNLGAKNTAKKGSAEYETPIQAYERRFKDAYKNAARAAGSAYKSPGISKALQNWNGNVRAQGARLTSANMAAAVRTPTLKKPEGATLRYVDAPRTPPREVTPLPGPGQGTRPPGWPGNGPRPVKPLPDQTRPGRPRTSDGPITPKPAPGLGRPTPGPVLPGPGLKQPGVIRAKPGTGLDPKLGPKPGGPKRPGPVISTPGAPRFGSQLLPKWEEE